MGDADTGPMQVDDPDYHNVDHTAVQTCGWTKNALRGEGRCYKNVFYRENRQSASGSFGRAKLSRDDERPPSFRTT